MLAIKHFELSHGSNQIRTILGYKSGRQQSYGVRVVPETYRKDPRILCQLEFRLWTKGDTGHRGAEAFCLRHAASLISEFATTCAYPDEARTENRDGKSKLHQGANVPKTGHWSPECGVWKAISTGPAEGRVIMTKYKLDYTLQW